MVFIDDVNNTAGIVCWFIVGVLLFIFVFTTEFHFSKVIIVPLYLFGGLIFLVSPGEEQILDEYLIFKSEINSIEVFSSECLSNDENFLMSLNNADTLIYNLGLKNVKFEICDFSQKYSGYSVWECKKKKIGQFYLVNKDEKNLFGFMIK